MPLEMREVPEIYPVLHLIHLTSAMVATTLHMHILLLLYIYRRIGIITAPTESEHPMNINRYSYTRSMQIITGPKEWTFPN